MQNEQGIKAWVKEQMQRLPASYTYHNYEHCLYVRNKAEEIGGNERISDDDMKLLTAAALWHDVGFIHIYKGHEEEGCALAKQWLPGFGFNANEIEIICGLVMATKMPQSPFTKLEEISADADLAYLGTADAERQADNLFRELHALTPSLTRDEWHRTQIHFLENHHYFTAYAQSVIEPGKKAYLKQLKTIYNDNEANNERR